MKINNSFSEQEGVGLEIVEMFSPTVYTQGHLDAGDTTKKTANDNRQCCGFWTSPYLHREKKRACWPLLPWNLFQKLTTLWLSFHSGLTWSFTLKSFSTKDACITKLQVSGLCQKNNNRNSHSSICLDQLQDVWTVFIHKAHFRCQLNLIRI